MAFPTELIKLKLNKKKAGLVDCHSATCGMLVESGKRFVTKSTTPAAAKLYTCIYMNGAVADVLSTCMKRTCKKKLHETSVGSRPAASICWAMSCVPKENISGPEPRGPWVAASHVRTPPLSLTRASVSAVVATAGCRLWYCG